MNADLFRRWTAKFLIVLLWASTAFAQSSKQQHAHLSLIFDRRSLLPGESQWIGLRFDLDPGWHIYWTNPGDSGEPPKIAWHLPSGVQAGDMQFPVPQRIPDHSLMDYGYQGNVVLLSKLTVPAGAASKQAEIEADVKYLVCREICVPGKDHLSATLPVSSEGKAPPEAAQIAAAKSHLPQSLPRGVRVSATASQSDFDLIVTGWGGSFIKATDFIPADEQVVDNTALPKIDPGIDHFVIKLKKSEQLDHPISRLRGLLIAGDQAYNVEVPVSSGRTTARKKVKE